MAILSKPAAEPDNPDNIRRLLVKITNLENALQKKAQQLDVAENKRKQAQERVEKEKNHARKKIAHVQEKSRREIYIVRRSERKMAKKLKATEVERKNVEEKCNNLEKQVETLEAEKTATDAAFIKLNADEIKRKPIQTSKVSPNTLYAGSRSTWLEETVKVFNANNVTIKVCTEFTRIGKHSEIGPGLEGDTKLTKQVIAKCAEQVGTIQLLLSSRDKYPGNFLYYDNLNIRLVDLSTMINVTEADGDYLVTVKDGVFEGLFFVTVDGSVLPDYRRPDVKPNPLGYTLFGGMKIRVRTVRKSASVLLKIRSQYQQNFVFLVKKSLASTDSKD